MWWMPLITLGMNKMQENKAKEDLRAQQTHAIRSNIAGQFGSPGYGEDTARAMYDSQRQIDAQRRARNSQMLQGVFSSMGNEAPEAPAYGPGVDPPAPDGDDGQSPAEKAEIEKARNALRRLG